MCGVLAMPLWGKQQPCYRPPDLTMTTFATMVINMVSKAVAARQTIQASEFKAKCLALMDDVARTGGVWVVTKNGRPIAELRPYSGKRAGSPFGLHPKLAITGDIVAPMNDIEWKVLA